MEMKAVVAGVACLCSMAASPMSAQSGEWENPHLRNDCRLAAQVIRSGNPAPRREWAFEKIVRCDESGPAILSQVWRMTVTAQPADLAQLYRATRQFNDRRLIDALIFAFRHAERSEPIRVNAGVLLFSYAVPGIYLDADQLLSGSESLAIHALSHDTRAGATRASLGDLRPELTNLLTAVIAAEPESRVGRAAATMLKYLGYLSQ